RARGARGIAGPPPSVRLFVRPPTGRAAGPVSAPAATGGLGWAPGAATGGLDWARAIWAVPSPRMMRTKGTTKLPAAITTADKIRGRARVRGSRIEPPLP